MRMAKIFLFLMAGLLLAPAGAAFAADDLQAVLAKLDAAAVRFKSTSADFEFDSVQTDPIPDKDVQTGKVYYERKGDKFQMGVHVEQVNGKPVPKVIVCCAGGNIRMYEKLINQVTTLTKFSQYQSWFMLGFGATGKELAEKWDITDDGAETLDGVTTEKLELVPKDAAVRKNLPKVTVWMDTDRGISLKQVFDEGPGQYRVSVYFNVRLNTPLPGDAFTFKTDGKTQYINR